MTIPREVIFGCPNCWEVHFLENEVNQKVELVDSYKTWKEIKQEFPHSNRIDRIQLLNSSGELLCPKCNRKYIEKNNQIDLLPETKFTKESISFYNQNYLENNKSWHIEDSNEKIQNIIQVLGKENPSSLLFLGCGPGYILTGINEYIKPNLSIGLDISETALLNKRDQANCLYILGDAEYLPFRSQSIDLVLAIDVIEHLHNPARGLLEISRVGKRIISKIPLENSLYTYVKEFFGDKRRIRFREKFGHLHQFDYIEVEGLFESNMFSINNKIFQKIPNREGIENILQDLIYNKFIELYPYLFGGFILVYAKSKYE